MSGDLPEWPVGVPTSAVLVGLAEMIAWEAAQDPSWLAAHTELAEEMGKLVMLVGDGDPRLFAAVEGLRRLRSELEADR